MTKTTLKPCPYCGGYPNQDVHYSAFEVPTLYSVSCSNPCCVAAVIQDTEELAVMAWNTRNQPVTPKALSLEELETLVYDQRKESSR